MEKNKIDELFNGYLKNSKDTINIKKLIKIMEYYSKKWNEFKRIFKTIVNDSTAEISDINIIEYDNKKYIILTINMSEHIIIDIEDGNVKNNKEIIHEYLKKYDYDESVENFFNTEDFYYFKNQQEQNFIDILDFIKKHPFILENIDIEYNVECESGFACLYISVRSNDAELYLKDKNGDIEMIFFDEKMNVIKCKRFLDNKEKLTYVVDNIKNIEIPRRVIPKIYLKSKEK